MTLRKSTYSAREKACPHCGCTDDKIVVDIPVNSGLLAFAQTNNINLGRVIDEALCKIHVEMQK